MVKVEIADTPSAQIVAAAKRVIAITDALGRAIEIKRPGPLEKLDFAKAAGSGSGGEVNQLYLAEIMHLQFVKSIDGTAVIVPKTEGELRALYSRLDEEGNDAVRTAVFEHFMASATGNAEADLKNS
jgi:hypothetical protein